ncbi:hypothetical protein AArcMg_3291 [Natrarchaeobaculum sulfurireducens]|uniref:Uncharacterized protein n=1 Tax=Natrarchaeobaculum sulfurireducens TaxID=2044521 RepID=A0A346PUT0_9EURY|nr:hypothetical protein AArcMg_3291 [Natrarchaeobaculum sulfurireducens]
MPAGEAGKALKSTDTMQSTVDRISTPQVQRAAQIAKQGGQTATAPVRYSRQQLSRGLHGSAGLTREGGERVLSGVRSSADSIGSRNSLVETMSMRRLSINSRASVISKTCPRASRR